MNAFYFYDAFPISEGLFWNLKALKKGNKDDEIICVHEIAKYGGTFCCQGDNLEGKFKYICI